MSHTFFVMKSKNNILLAFGCSVLTGCSLGGGNADLNPVETKPIIVKPKPPAPSKDDVVEIPEKNHSLPKHGLAFKNPNTRYLENKKSEKWFENFIEKPNLVLGQGDEAKNTIINLRAEDMYVLDESSSLDEITLMHPTYWQENGKINVKLVEKKVSNLTRNDGSWVKVGDFMMNEDGNLILLNFENTQMGFISYSHTKLSTEDTLSNATLFYRGVERANSLPASLSAHYSGNWAYMLPMSYYTAQNGDGGNYTGQNLSGGKGNTSFIVDIDVNFGDKSLKGKLSGKNKKTGDEKLYFDISARLQGNQFTGKATSKQNNEEALNKDSDALHGGFYGKDGKELAGAFYVLVDKNKPNGDKTLAVAFIAKKDSKDAVKTALLTNGNRSSWKNISSKVDTADLGYIDDVNQLNIIDEDGKRVVLDLNNKEEQTINGTTYFANVCCDNFQFLRFGNVTQTNKSSDSTASNIQESLFVQGVSSTDLSDIPKSGQAHYVGKWQMRTVVESAYTNGGSSLHEVKGDAVYDIDFNDKKLTGSLMSDGGVNANGKVHPGHTPWINIDADIKGNKFSGTAEMPESKGVDIVYKSINIDFDKVNGGLFGPGAAELGGHISSNDGKSGVVFGGKKQK